MKKLIAIMAVIVLSTSLGYSRSYTSWSQGGKFGGTLEVEGATTLKGAVTLEDTLTVGDDLSVSGGLSVDEVFINVKQEFVAPAAASTVAYINSDTVTPSTTTPIVYDLETSSYTMAGVSRNVTAVVDGDATAYAGTLTIAGIDALGNTASEVLNISTTSAAGNVAWARIDTLTVLCTSFTSIGSEVDINIGTGVKLGLVNNITAVGDVYKVVENAAHVSPAAGKINATYNTYEPTSAADGSKNYEVHYKTNGR